MTDTLVAAVAVNAHAKVGVARCKGDALINVLTAVGALEAACAGTLVVATADTAVSAGTSATGRGFCHLVFEARKSK